MDAVHVCELQTGVVSVCPSLSVSVCVSLHVSLCCADWVCVYIRGILHVWHTAVHEKCSTMDGGHRAHHYDGWRVWVGLCCTDRPCVRADKLRQRQHNKFNGNRILFVASPLLLLQSWCSRSIGLTIDQQFEIIVEWRFSFFFMGKKNRRYQTTANVMSFIHCTTIFSQIFYLLLCSLQTQPCIPFSIYAIVPWCLN